MRLEVNSKPFEISNHVEKSFRLHGNFTTAKLEISNPFQKLFHLHGDFTATTFQVIVRGCSYGGEPARLGGLAPLSEISPFLRNSYKNIMCSYEKWASLPRWDLT